jgi:NAD-reducing hydrogenase large subunit
MSKKITIAPITRVEGHGKVTIHLDEAGQVQESRLHIVEFRGFERFIQGYPYWEVPLLVQRLCGICPVSHHLAAAKAIDRLHGLEPEQLSATSTKLRRLLHYGQIFQSHALHFFYLASPDLLFGLDAPAGQRNIAAVAIKDKELARRGILMRKFGQQLIEALAGKRIHGNLAIPGGVYKTFDPEERSYFLNGKEIPSIYTMIEWAQATLTFIKDYHLQNQSFLDQFAAYPSGHLGLVNEAGGLELYHGRLRAIDARGKRTLADVFDADYEKYFAEGVESWTYLKFPYLRHLGREKGWNRVGPLARLNVADFIPTPLAELERQTFFAEAGHLPKNATMHYHWARLIEMLHCAEIIRDLLEDDEIMGSDLLREGERRPVGVGVLEAPRGTLIHHYEADEKGMVTRANLIVSTTHNNEAMNRAVHSVVTEHWASREKITEPMLNQVEIAIRAYDPCLSCATHALGQMPLHLSVFDHQNKLIDEYYRD